MLFFDPDWIRFFVRVTTPTQPLLPPDRAARLADPARGGHPALLDFALSLLERDPLRRPGMAEAVARFSAVQVQGRRSNPKPPKPQPARPEQTPHARSPTREL